MNRFAVCFPHRLMRCSWLSACFAVAGMFAMSPWANAEGIRVTIENLGVDGNTYVTPVFTGFHDGTFDLFDPGSTASLDVERLAEDGNNSVLAGTFAGAGFTGGSVGGAPIAPGATVTRDFTIGMGTTPTSLLLATMVLPTNDWFLSSGDPLAFDISNLANGPLTFDLNRIYDAGTEVNDFATSAGNPLLGLAPGQGGPNVGVPENGPITFVGTIQGNGQVLDANNNVIADPFGGFAGANGFNPGLSPLRVTVTAVPEPSTMLATGLFAVGGLIHRQRRRKVKAAKKA